MSWLLLRNKSASDTFPVVASKTYAFWIFTQGSLRRSLFNRSRIFEKFFSFKSNFLRAAIHSVWDTTLRTSVPLTVLILGMACLVCGFFEIFHAAWSKQGHLCLNASSRKTSWDKEISCLRDGGLLIGQPSTERGQVPRGLELLGSRKAHWDNEPTCWVVRSNAHAPGLKSTK